jgi:hypothetical protein
VTPSQNTGRASDVAWPLARLASQRGTRCRRKRRGPAVAETLAAAEARAKQARQASAPREKVSLTRPPPAAQPQRQGPRDDGGARHDAAFRRVLENIRTLDLAAWLAAVKRCHGTK